MFEELFTGPIALARQRESPLAEERRIAITSAGVLSEVAFAHEVLEQEAAYPGTEQIRVTHG